MPAPLRTIPAFLILAALAAPSVGEAQQLAPRIETSARTIRVSGMGEARAAPDEARIELAVETLAPTARAAGEENALIMDRVIAALVRAGVPREEIETRGYSVYPEYREPRPGDTTPAIRGYRAANTVSARTERLDRVGALIDVALGAGANRLNGIAFGIRNDAAPRAEALRNAVAEARRAAETIAMALGVQLGPVLDASTAAAPPQPVYEVAAMRMRDFAGAPPPPPPTPVQPGEQTITATASLVFAIGSGL